MRLVISLATRGRPQKLLDTVRRSVANLVCPETIFVIQADEDDKETQGVTEQLTAIDPRIMVSSRPREDTIAAKWNRALTIPADLYLVAADDDPYITPAYDAKLLEAAELFPDGIGMVYGHMANASFSGVVAPTARFCEKMGDKIFPEYFPYWFCDHWTDDVAKIVGRISFADVKTDQSRVGKTQELREPAWWATWFDAAYLMRRRQAHEIIRSSDLEDSKWRKQVLLSHHPLIEYRSRWINDCVRQSAAGLEQWSGLSNTDERYQRVRKQAEDMVPGLLAEMPPETAAWMRPILDPPKTVMGLRQAFA